MAENPTDRNPQAAKTAALLMLFFNAHTPEGREEFLAIAPMLRDLTDEEVMELIGQGDGQDEMPEPPQPEPERPQRHARSGDFLRALR